jgi:type IV secretory pathway TrbL component
MWPLLASGSAAIGDSLAATLLTMVKFGVFYWILVNLAAMTDAALNTFFQWGLAPGGGGVSLATFRQPGAIVLLGFELAKPLIDFPTSLWSKITGAFAMQQAGYWVAYGIVVLSFGAVALHLMMVLIEFYMAVMLSAVLIPWGVLTVTAFFTEFSIGWITGGLVRILVTTAMVAIAAPLFSSITIPATAGGDPTIFGGAMTVVVSLIYAILSWVVPGRAANIAGRGVSLALQAGTVLSTAAGAGRGVLMLQSAIRGVSQMMRR